MLDEIKDLKDEIEILGEPGSKRAKKEKEKKLDHLQKIAEVLYAEENQTKSGRFDKRKMKKLMPKIQAYLDTIAKTRNGFVNNELVFDVLCFF